MHFSRSLAAILALFLTLPTIGMTTPVSTTSGDEAAIVGGVEMTEKPKPYLMSHEQMMHWIANTDAKLTFIGKPINSLAPRSAQDTTVTYCTERINDVCGGSCAVYTGGATCLYAPGTVCLAATYDVAFCSSAQCSLPCTELYDCSAYISDGFCPAPDTVSIFVSGA